MITNKFYLDQTKNGGCFKAMKKFVYGFITTFFLSLGCITLPSVSFAQSPDQTIVNVEDFSISGNVLVFTDLPNVAWIIGKIENGDYFHFRRMIRRNSIDTVALASPGGNVFESLQIAAAIHDQELSTVVPLDASCASACAFLFFAGSERDAIGELGVHQFYGPEEQAPMNEVQFTVSEIVGFLNEFQTPPFVFEYMFENEEMHFFTDPEKLRLSRDGADTEKGLTEDLTASINRTYQQLISAVEESASQNEPVNEQDIQPPNNDPSPNPSEPETAPQTSDAEATSFWQLSLQCSDFELNEEIGFYTNFEKAGANPNEEIQIVWWPNGNADVLGKISLFERPLATLTLADEAKIFRIVGDLATSPSLVVSGMGNSCDGVLRRIERPTLPVSERSYSDEELTRLIQSELNRLGCTLGESDGVVGRRSAAALRAFLDNAAISAQFDLSLFRNISFYNSLKSLEAPICLTPPVPAPYDVSGVWNISFTCPNNRSFDGTSEIYGKSGNSYRIRYYDQWGVGFGTLVLNGRSVSGSVEYKGERTSFEYRLSTGGTILTGTTSNSCNVRARRVSR
jgi:hypothetical protein